MVNSKLLHIKVIFLKINVIDVLKHHLLALNKYKMLICFSNPKSFSFNEVKNEH